MAIAQMLSVMRARQSICFWYQRQLALYALPTRCSLCSAAAKTRMAVPFIAAEKPSERSEYKHPDKSIIVTKRAKYLDGLSSAEVQQLMAKLCSLMPSQQEGYYRCATIAKIARAAHCSGAAV